MTLCNSVTFKIWVTLEFSQHHGNLKPKRFSFVSNTSQLIGLVHFIINDCNYLVLWKKLASVAFLKCFSILKRAIYTYVIYKTSDKSITNAHKNEENYISSHGSRANKPRCFTHCFQLRI